jgi:putative endonuclease
MADEEGVHLYNHEPWKNSVVHRCNERHRNKDVAIQERSRIGMCRLKYLVNHEEHASIYVAIMREKHIKNWHRDWKINLSKSVNPEMRDLSDELL